MNRKDFEALIPAYVLDALDPEDEQAVESLLTNPPGAPARRESIGTWPPPSPWLWTRSLLIPESSLASRSE